MAYLDNFPEVIFSYALTNESVHGIDFDHGNARHRPWFLSGDIILKYYHLPSYKKK
jgi:hypothetical protein